MSFNYEFTSAFGGIGDMGGLAAGPVANDPLRSCLGVRFLRRNRENSGCQRPDQSVNLSHAPGHKTPDRYIWMEVVVDRPDHGAPGLVRHIDYGIVWHIDPDHFLGVGVFR